MRRPRKAFAVLLAATTVVAVACGSASTKNASTTSGTVPTSIPPGTTLRVADQLGAFQNQLAAAGENKNFPYTVQYSSFLGGPAVLQAFQAGSVDISYVAGTPSIFAQAAHQGVVDVASEAFQYSSYVLASAPGKSFTSWSQLKGKTVAFQQGTVEESLVLQGLQSAGLSYKDVKPVNLQTTALLQALEGKKVDAAILVQPYTGVYLQKYPHAVILKGDNDITDRDGFVIASTSALKNPAKEAAIADYITRLVKATEFDYSHPEIFAEDYYVKQFGLPLKTALAIIEANGTTSWYDLPGPFVKPQQNLANLYAEAGEIPNTENVAAEFTPLYNKTVDAAVKAASPGTSSS